jgi:hypothetical protein
MNPPEESRLVPLQVSFADAMLRALEPVPVARTAEAVAEAVALGLMLGLAEAAGAEAIVSAPKAKAPAATPASIDLLERIALDNAFPFDASVRRRSDVGFSRTHHLKAGITMGRRSAGVARVD